jgi:predicted transcriptional regulator/transcriptional regulator with XRE-family HTH domain
MQNLTGLKIRSVRKRVGLSQGELARRAGISASYLNLIEFNRRKIAGVLLDRIAAGLGVERGLLDGEAERRAVERLNEVAADLEVGEGAAPPPGAEELAARHPAWARLTLRLYQAYLDERQAVLALADRLNRDPFLGESIHRMLSRVTAIRSAAEILQGETDLRPDDRARFISIVGSESDDLSATARSLLAFFDNANFRIRSATPMEQVDAFVAESGNHFPVLEEAADAVLREGRPGEAPDQIALRLLGSEGPDCDDAWRVLPAATQRFRLVREAARQVATATVDDLVTTHPALESEEARTVAASALLNYTAAAILMPYGPFLDEAEHRRYDIDLLGRRFGVSYEQAAHRCATLRRPGGEGVRFAFMRSDPSGYVTKRLPLPNLPPPRYGHACPLWPIYGAFQTPGVTVRTFGELPGGDRFLFFARAVEKAPPSARTPRHLLSVMLACSGADADRVIYAEGIDRGGAMAPVGTNCRLCPRTGCRHRQEPPLIA